MTRKELIAAYALKRECSNKEAKRAVNTFLEIVMNEISDGRKVTISGFGTFAVHERKEKNCRNPRTGEKMKTSSRKVPFFKASGIFREMVNQKQK
jgi:DNA-binding protein HU-beta